MTRVERRAACDILKYIQKEPNVKHTAQGIASYWIFQQRLEEKLDIVLTAIDFLVKEGFLQKIIMTDKQCVYKINVEMLKDIPKKLSSLNKND